MISKVVMVYGGWWGSEGKGDVCAAECKTNEGMVIGVRVGGPNAGHTIVDHSGRIRKLQQVPVTAFVRRDSLSVLGASAVIDPHVLVRELGWLQETWEGNPPPLVIDSLATFITPNDKEAEQTIKGAISSTGEGVGAATAAKVMRRAASFQMLHYTDAPLREQITPNVSFADTVPLLNGVARGELERFMQVPGVEWPDRHPWILIEGTQGTLLSLNTGGYYPYCTSRDCTPEAIFGQVGLSPRAFDIVHIVCVMRTFPIRVGGPSGPLPNEITWETLQQETGGYVSTPEVTTVTGKNRRIARWSPDIAQQVIDMTRPTSLAVSFLDYIDPTVVNCKDYHDLSEDAMEWLSREVIPLVSRSACRLRWVGVGPHDYLRVP